MEYMPTDLQYKDDLRKQRDNWAFVMRQLEKCSSIKDDEGVRMAYDRAQQEYNRIIESLQD